ncbi:MAG: hypothetical protein OHK0039_02810 [Bacteroidia bacterium]
METLTANPRTLNVREEVAIVLQMVASLEGRYGANYVVQLLRGWDRYGLREEAHRNLETFGALQKWHTDRIHHLIDLLMEEGLLACHNIQYGTLHLTVAGEQFLQAPQDWLVKSATLRSSKYERMLAVELRQIRMALSREEQTEPYRIFNDYTLQCILDKKPQDLEGLKMIPGLGDYKINRYGALIIQAVMRVAERKSQDNYHAMLKRVKSPGYQTVKMMYEHGLSEAEMAAERMVKPVTIRRILLDLHRAAEIDLRPWIEQQVQPTDLEKAGAFFRQEESPRLREAYEYLGLDYDTLRLCRLYVADHTSYVDELKIAS